MTYSVRAIIAMLVNILHRIDKNHNFCEKIRYFLFQTCFFDFYDLMCRGGDLTFVISK